jgi:predicted enzyme related to lactoylglutathione lyase
VNLSPKIIETITVFAEDLELSKRFYPDVFGLSVIFEDEISAVFKFKNAQINLLTIPAARNLIEAAVVASPEAGSRFMFTIPVDDVDSAGKELKARGVVKGPMNRPWGVRTASFTHVGGHIWEFAQPLPQSV